MRSGVVAFSVSFSNRSPYASGTPFQIEYTATNGGPDDPHGHLDRVVVRPTDATWQAKPWIETVDLSISAPPTTVGQSYTTPVDLKLPSGDYDIGVAAPNDTPVGRELIQVLDYA
jgi:hypothetical protein